jgi:hypothetical protein
MNTAAAAAAAVVAAYVVITQMEHAAAKTTASMHGAAPWQPSSQLSHSCFPGTSSSCNPEVSVQVWLMTMKMIW